MRITFFSNFYNHHQKYLADELYRLTDGDFRFVATCPMDDERVALGYTKDPPPPYVIDLSTGAASETLSSLVADTDVLIYGSPAVETEPYFLKTNAVLIRYSERPFKDHREFYKFIPRFFRWRKRFPPKRNVYLLGASAYAAKDYAKLGLFLNRSYRWGYFPETKRYESLSSLMAGKDRREILWCGRFLDWKHPDDAMRVAKRLRDEGYDFTLKLIGTGEMQDMLSQMIRDHHLDDQVRLCDPMPPEEVRYHMERAGIYLFTGDYREGWGAVLNEAMNSGCAVIANRAAGATPYLVKDGINGLIYPQGSTEMLYRHVKSLLDAPEKQEALGKEAYATIADEWNASVAASRLLNILERIQNGEVYPDVYDTGPCSWA